MANDCIITAPPTRKCKDEQYKGGIKNLFLANAKDIATITFTADKNLVTGITMVGQTKFFKLDPKLFSAEYKDNFSRANGIPAWKHTLEIFMHQSLDTDQSTANVNLEWIQSLAVASGLVIIYETFEGTSAIPMYSIAGVWENETVDFARFAFMVSKDDFTTGKNLTDANGDSIELTSDTPKKRYKFGLTVPV